MPFPKYDRFALYDISKKKNPDTLTTYPRMLRNDDGSTIIAEDEEQHRQISGKRFDPDSYVGAKRGEGPVAHTPLLPVAPSVPIPDAALQRSGAKLKSLDGGTQVDQVPLQEMPHEDTHVTE